MEIRKLEIDFDSDVLKINGQEIKEIPVIVTLPGPENDFPFRKLFNAKIESEKKEVIDKLEVSYTKGHSLN